jgi:hypothetical protein
MFKTRCQACGKQYEFHEDKENKQLECVQCGQVFTAARIGGAAQPAAAPKAAPSSPPSSPRPAPPPPSAQGTFITDKPEPQGAGPKAKMLFVLGLLMVLGFIGYSTVLVMGGGGLPEWSRTFVPQGAQSVVYMDMEKVRGSNVFAKIKDAVGEQGDSLFMIYQMGLLKSGEGAKVTGNDVKSMIMAGNLMSGNFSDLVIGLQLKKDFSIADMTAGMQVTAKKHNDTDYHEAVSGTSTTYVCRLDAAL